MAAMTVTDIEVDLDRAPALTEAPTVSSWLDQPKLVAGVIAAIGVVAIAAAAIIIPAVSGQPAPVAVPPAPTCVEVPAAAPLPAFAITAPTSGDIPAYEDTGVWTWRQMLLLPTDVGAEPRRQLIGLQTASKAAPAITVQTAGDQLLAVTAANREIVVQYPPGAFGGWAELKVSSMDRPDGDLLAVDIVGAGGQSGQVLKLPGDAHSALTGFALSTPLGSAAGEVAFGSPTFTTTSPGC